MEVIHNSYLSQLGITSHTRTVLSSPAEAMIFSIPSRGHQDTELVSQTPWLASSDAIFVAVISFPFPYMELSTSAKYKNKINVNTVIFQTLILPSPPVLAIHPSESLPLL